jgi:predicted RNA-binding Zn ribbon-like protein
VTDRLPRRPPEGRDPRPLLGEPLALDLLNTHWLEDGRLQDLLATVQGVATWLHSAALAPDAVTGPTDVVGEALRSARDVVQDLAEHPDSQRAIEAFNALLARGRRERRVDRDGPSTRLVVDDPTWSVPWLVAENYLDLLERAPDRIRRCEHPECVLWYFDSSRSGTRRWCSMSVCGNRAKATRHYRRRVAGGPDQAAPAAHPVRDDSTPA